MTPKSRMIKIDRANKTTAGYYNKGKECYNKGNAFVFSDDINVWMTSAYGSRVHNKIPPLF